MNIFLSILIVLLATPAFAQFYEYKDRNGNIVITDSPPPGMEGQKKQLQEDRIYRSSRAEKDYPVYDSRPTNARPVKQEEQKKDYSRVSVVMYMADWCGYCKKAREYIRSQGADLVEYNIDKNKGRRDEMKQKTGGRTGIPVIDIEGTIIQGYSTDAIKAALDKNAR